MSSPASLKYSHAVRARVIDTAVMLMQRAGCEVSQLTDDTGCTLSVINPKDMPDKHSRMVRQALESAQIDCDTSD